MTGRNSNNHWYLAYSGIELYGTTCGGIVSSQCTAKLSPSQQQLAPQPQSTPVNHTHVTQVITGVEGCQIFLLVSNGETLYSIFNCTL